FSSFWMPFTVWLFGCCTRCLRSSSSGARFLTSSSRSRWSFVALSASLPRSRTDLAAATSCSILATRPTAVTGSMKLRAKGKSCMYKPARQSAVRRGKVEQARTDKGRRKLRNSLTSVGPARDIYPHWTAKLLNLWSTVAAASFIRLASSRLASILRDVRP
ncbi:hypothetical protein C8J57DRAFT_1369663, partial [Mycena rebaudengoi]